MKEKLIKELIVVLLSTDFKINDNICKRYNWENYDVLKLEFSGAVDNKLYFCSGHIINEFCDPDIKSIGQSELGYRITYTISYNGLDDFFDDILDIIDNSERNQSGIILPFDGFDGKIKDVILDAVYGTIPLTMESLAIKILSKTEFSDDGIAKLISYSKKRNKG